MGYLHSSDSNFLSEQNGIDLFDISTKKRFINHANQVTFYYI